GKRFDARRAYAAGLVSRVVAPGELDGAVDEEVAECLQAGPLAASATKRLLHDLDPPDAPEVVEQTAQLIAQLRSSPEGQEGLAAFLDKREPEWRA
ncbi:MAG TPA: enoyl-CoA hydratase/isomerase family protein, partial [Firmicutes bacterium]|nr:enoyl-CoA hydratase/isomerase family protein [Bacillota bacterium]